MIKTVKIIYHFFIDRFNLLKDKIDIFRGFFYDYRYYNSTNFICTSCRKDKLAAKIMLTMHELEKGMSFKKKPRVFGEAKANLMINCLSEYQKNNGVDELYITAINILNDYYNDPWSTRNQDSRNRLSIFISENIEYLKDSMTGVKKIIKPEPFDEDLIYNFFSTRSSVRDYSKQKVKHEEIQKAVDFAKVTPTACNRQTCRVYYYDNLEIMKKILDNQLGNQGWCDRASGIVVVTSNQALFGKSYERSESLIDGGLYAMNLVYGLHLQRIASCFKMYVREPRREKVFKQIAGIPHNEIPIVLILVGHYPDEVVLEPQSHRFNNIININQ